jgi:multidrug efflux pump subunit AcrA (membrane-fusion protein)
MFRADGPQVGIVQQDSKVELRKVKLGRDFGQAVEIVDGLNPEDRVIINPGESLENGSIVAVSESDKMSQGK